VGLARSFDEDGLERARFFEILRCDALSIEFEQEEEYEAIVMRQFLRSSVVCLLVLGCSSTPKPEPKLVSHADVTEVNSDELSNSGKTAESTAKSETSEWWKVVPSEGSDAEKRPAKQIGRVAINSDPKSHGESLRFRFLVNGTPISGVFQAPGGKTSSFSLPSGTVTFTIDECSWEEQGFPLASGEEIPLVCKRTNDGDCCEVAIPADEATAAKEERPEKSK
jgi:hypothetical protein